MPERSHIPERRWVHILCFTRRRRSSRSHIIMAFRRSIKIFLIVSLFVSAAQGQWKLLHDFGAQVYSIHFLDREGYPQIGFAGLTDGEVWRTSDGGASWQQASVPPTLIGAIRDFTFKDSLTGWLAASQSSLYSGC